MEACSIEEEGEQYKQSSPDLLLAIWLFNEHSNVSTGYMEIYLIMIHKSQSSLEPAKHAKSYASRTLQCLKLCASACKSLELGHGSI